MSLTSVELNYLIWRYLSESGYELAAYALQKHLSCLDYEHNQNKLLDSIDRGCLVNLVQKGILYLLVEDVAEGKEHRVTLAHALLKSKNEVILPSNGTVTDATEKATENTQDKDGEPESITPTPMDEDPLFVTAKLLSLKNFPSAVVTQWHPLELLYAYGTEDSSAAISGASLENPIILSHPGVASDAPSAVEAAVSIVSWLPGGTFLLTAAASGEIRAWSREGRLRNIANSPVAPDRVPSALVVLLWNPHGQLFVTIDAANTLCVWDGTSMALILEMRVADSGVSALAACWLSDLRFAVPSTRNSIKIFGVNPHAPPAEAIYKVAQLAGHASPISQLIFSPKLRLLASLSDEDYVIKVWNSLLSRDALEIAPAAGKLNPHAAPLVALLWLSRASDVQGNELLSVSMEGSVNVWDAFTGDELLLVNIFKNPDGYNLEDGLEIDYNTPLIFEAALSPDSLLLAVGDNSGSITIWDLDLPKYRGASQQLRCVAMFVPEERDAGICSLAWDSTSTELCVAYKGRDSVLLKPRAEAKI